MGIQGEIRRLMEDQAEVPKCQGDLSDNLARYRDTSTMTTHSEGGARYEHHRGEEGEDHRATPPAF